MGLFLPAGVVADGTFLPLTRADTSGQHLFRVDGRREVPDLGLVNLARSATRSG